MTFLSVKRKHVAIRIPVINANFLFSLWSLGIVETILEFIEVLDLHLESTGYQPYRPTIFREQCFFSSKIAFESVEMIWRHKC